MKKLPIELGKAIDTLFELSDKLAKVRWNPERRVCMNCKCETVGPASCSMRCCGNPIDPVEVQFTMVSLAKYLEPRRQRRTR